MDLGVDFNARVRGDHLIGDRDSLEDGDALLDDGVVLHAVAEVRSD